MLRPWNSQTPFAGVLTEHECPRCHQPVTLPLGELCAACRQNIERQAGRIARWVALVSTILLGLYLVLRLPQDPTARMVGVASVGIWYLLTHLVVKRIARTYLS